MSGNNGRTRSKNFPCLKGSDIRMKYEGSCQCGRCRFECEGMPKFRTICHCTICTGTSGGIAVALVGFERDAFRVVQGQESLRSYRSTKDFERFSCGICSSSVYNEPLVPEACFRATPLSNFKRDENGRIERLDELKPEAHIFFDRCPECYVDMFLKDGLPKFDGMPGRKEASE